ncbi:MAG: PKD domain-containing protein [Bacteroidota bacterium]
MCSKFDSIKKIIIPLLFFVFAFFETKATHIVGGELNYKYLGGNNYEIRLTIYRDACVGLVGFDSPASLGVFNSSNNLVFQQFMIPRDSGNVPPNLYDQCTDVPAFFCYKYCHYIDTINLPPLAGGYQLVYQRCCRNQNILNLINPNSVGATYTAFVPGPEVAAINSNPVFKNIVRPFVCANKPFIFDNSAIDFDGDSLVYELFTPFDGASTFNPRPQPPNDPPYAIVPWQAPYNTLNMLGGIAMTVNSSNGLVTATPSLQGYFVVGLKVKEYRKGVLLSETRRDYQIIVKPCPQIVVAAAQAPKIICGTTTIPFVNNSTGSSELAFNWYFGDPTTVADTSNVKSPTYIYPSSGTYSVTMVAYVNGKPLCNDTVKTTVSISSLFKASFTFSPIPCSNNLIAFKEQTEELLGINPVWRWNFGDGTKSNEPNPFHTFTITGNYQVTLNADIPDGLNCKDSLSIVSFFEIEGSELYIPNTFTPNGDGHNDVFKIRGPTYKEFYFAVYNRWGELIFETTDQRQGWDGNYKGKFSDSDVFGYYMKARCEEQSEEIFRKGNVTLIR